MQLGWFLHMQKQNGPQLPILMQRFVLWIFFLKNCVVELVSRTFLQSASHDNYVLVMTRLTFLSLIYMKLNLPSHSHTTMIDYKVFSIIVLQMGVN
jgi:hypothetical protein